MFKSNNSIVPNINKMRMRWHLSSDKYAYRDVYSALKGRLCCCQLLNKNLGILTNVRDRIRTSLDAREKTHLKHCNGFMLEVRLSLSVDICSRVVIVCHLLLL